MKTCQSYGEKIRGRATRCRFCGEIYNVLDGRRFKKDLEKLFPSIYLTMLSMIQGLVFAFLMYMLLGFIQKFFEHSPTQNASFVMFFILNLIILALIWYDYLYNLLLIRPPNLQDAI